MNYFRHASTAQTGVRYTTQQQQNKTNKDLSKNNYESILKAMENFKKAELKVTKI